MNVWVGVGFEVTMRTQVKRYRYVHCTFRFLPTLSHEKQILHLSSSPWLKDLWLGQNNFHTTYKTPVLDKLSSCPLLPPSPYLLFDP